MTAAEILAIRKGLAKAQGWIHLDVREGQGFAPGMDDSDGLWPIPDPFANGFHFADLLVWALKKDIDIYLTCVTPESSPDFCTHAKRLFGPKVIKSCAESQCCGGDVPALLRAGTLAIWEAIREDEATKGEEKP